MDDAGRYPNVILRNKCDRTYPETVELLVRHLTLIRFFALAAHLAHDLRE